MSAHTHAVPALSRDDELVDVKNLSYRYGKKEEWMLQDVTYTLKPGSRCLLLGQNGSGKTTFLKVLAGRLILEDPDSVFICKRRPFYDLPPGIVYVSSEVNPFHLEDSSIVEQLLKRSGGDASPERRDELIKVLKIDTRWRMNKISDGQRRRVLIAMSLIHCPHLLLLDEATIDMDIEVRRRFFEYLVEQSNATNLTIICCTHIFDGLGGWPSHILHLDNGRVGHAGELSPETFPEVLKASEKFCQIIDDNIASEGNPEQWTFWDSKMYLLAECWLREEIFKKVKN